MGGKCLSAAVPFSIHSLQEMRERATKKKCKKKKRERNRMLIGCKQMDQPADNATL